MLNNKKILALITARGGSKGLPGKNIRDLAGKPLIAWSIEAALASKYIDRLILSSEDPTIIETARKYGCEAPFVRAPELATDKSTTIDVVVDAINRLPGFDWIIVLQPTSPLRTTNDIDTFIEDTFAHQAQVAVSVCEVSKSPYWMYSRAVDGRLNPILPLKNLATRRQDLPIVYQLNGALYAAECEWLLKNRTFLCEKTYSFVMSTDNSVDIDDEVGFLLAESLICQNTENRPRPN